MKIVSTFLLSGFLFLTTADKRHHGRNQYHHKHPQGRELRKGRHCGFVEPTELQRAEIDATVSKHMAQARPLSKVDEIIIDVYWNVLINADGIGDYNDAVIEKSIQILNDAYGGIESSYSECSGSDQSFTYSSFPSTPFKFVLKETKRVVNDAAYDMDETASENYRENNRVGDCSDLNIFTGGTEYLGFATLPYYCPNESYLDPEKKDSVVLRADAVTGTLAQYNEGDTLVHEVGHWLGLYHTFQDGCDAPGDNVSDTAPEGEAAYGCPIGRNTCAGGEDDPIHNFMDYSDDCCMYRFTQEQVTRMVSQARTWRGLEFTGTDEPTITPVPTGTYKPSIAPVTDEPTIAPVIDEPTIAPVTGTDAPVTVTDECKGSDDFNDESLSLKKNLFQKLLRSWS